MTSTLACIAKILNLKYFEFLHLLEKWTGSEKCLNLLLEEINRPSFDGKNGLIEIEKIVKTCRFNNIEVLWPGHDLYPKGFLNIHQSPCFLTYLGNKELIQKQSLSVVGTREPSVWIENWLEQELKKTLLDTGVMTVSGGARGVDQRVHQLSLRQGLSTLAILPSGVLNIYPKSLKRFYDYFDRGQLGLLSEYFPWEPMRKHHFHCRNRLISAWSPLIFIVQAHQKSGTMITAYHAIDQGRTVCTLPGSPMDSSMYGNLQLLFDGAQMIRWNSDLSGLIPPKS